MPEANPPMTARRGGRAIPCLSVDCVAGGRGLAHLDVERQTNSLVSDIHPALIPTTWRRQLRLRLRRWLILLLLL